MPCHSLPKNFDETVEPQADCSVLHRTHRIANESSVGSSGATVIVPRSNEDAAGTPTSKDLANRRVHIALFTSHEYKDGTNQRECSTLQPYNLVFFIHVLFVIRNLSSPSYSSGGDSSCCLVSLTPTQNEWDFAVDATFADCWCGEGKHGRWIDSTDLLFADPRHAQMANSSAYRLHFWTMRIALVALQLTRCWCARLAADHSGTILVVDDTSFNFTSQLEYDVLISSSSAGMATVFLTQPPDVVSDMKHGSSSSLTLVSLVFCARLMRSTVFDRMKTDEKKEEGEGGKGGVKAERMEGVDGETEDSDTDSGEQFGRESAFATVELRRGEREEEKEKDEREEKSEIMRAVSQFTPLSFISVCSVSVQ
ncbi:hypothetical protein BLNAU_20618 [Blattamonas nauphoetae]|uniref:Uncharacterized protein n=1 Tax=Blattamonas nauphoetae TaxID=2049346 RepID=A0ABQ9X2E8_9EUKA|nr:hypothetical protein BLNAU_20618 [Blattamonas nauphoetae]